MTVTELGLRVKAVVTVNSAKVIVMTAVMTGMTAIMTVVTAITEITVLLLSQITGEEKPGGRSNFHFKNIEPILITESFDWIFQNTNVLYEQKKEETDKKSVSSVSVPGAGLESILLHLTSLY